MKVSVLWSFVFETIIMYYVVALFVNFAIVLSGKMLIDVLLVILSTALGHSYLQCTQDCRI